LKRRELPWSPYSAPTNTGKRLAWGTLGANSLPWSTEP
jgi:hypothetical protein